LDRRRRHRSPDRAPGISETQPASPEMEPAHPPVACVRLRGAPSGGITLPGSERPFGRQIPPPSLIVPAVARSPPSVVPAVRSADSPGEEIDRNLPYVRFAGAVAGFPRSIVYPNQGAGSRATAARPAASPSQACSAATRSLRHGRAPVSTRNRSQETCAWAVGIKQAERGLQHALRSDTVWGTRPARCRRRTAVSATFCYQGAEFVIRSETRPPERSGHPPARCPSRAPGEPNPQRACGRRLAAPSVSRRRR
jgi:hypothetical protein